MIVRRPAIDRWRYMSYGGPKINERVEELAEKKGVKMTHSWATHGKGGTRFPAREA